MSKKNNIDFLQIIADDKSLITYRPKLNQITGSVTATILLQQTLYWWMKAGREPFYKFKAPCKHSLYKKGDSWCEELGFNKYEIDRALKKIGDKTTAKEQKTGNKFIYFWTTRDRLTFYNIHFTNLAKAGSRIYLKPDLEFTKSRISNLHYSTETTTETISEIPDWLPKELWQTFLEHRKSFKPKLTPHAEKLNLNKLIKFHKQGYDCEEIINNTIANGWKSFFEPKYKPKNNNGEGTSAYESVLKNQPPLEEILN